MILEFTTVTIGATDPVRLADFYAALLNWEVGHTEPGYVILNNPSGGVGLAFQAEPDQPAPVWPARTGDPHMQMHLDIRVDDLTDGLSHALHCGATMASYQPQSDVRVCIDPAGHPFCLWVEP
ncbi:MAG: VOC family protein [Micropruina sp.]|nr:VOC family protein [Micropruina sp.]